MKDERSQNDMIRKDVVRTKNKQILFLETTPKNVFAWIVQAPQQPLRAGDVTLIPTQSVLAVSQ